jgi:hypothetical protein
MHRLTYWPRHLARPANPKINMTTTFVAFRYQLRGLMRAANCKIERQFATFADVPYHDPLSRQQWEQLWRADQ